MTDRKILTCPRCKYTDPVKVSDLARTSRFCPHCRSEGVESEMGASPKIAMSDEIAKTLHAEPLPTENLDQA